MSVLIHRPNLITLTGFCASLSGLLCALLYSNWMTETLARWQYAYISFVLVFYMAMDAVDGKQARKTGTSSPLGQLFDHGCDAINLIFTVFMSWAAFNLEPGRILLFTALLCTLHPNTA